MRIAVAKLEAFAASPCMRQAEVISSVSALNDKVQRTLSMGAGSRLGNGFGGRESAGGWW